MELWANMYLTQETAVVGHEAGKLGVFIEKGLEMGVGEKRCEFTNVSHRKNVASSHKMVINIMSNSIPVSVTFLRDEEITVIVSAVNLTQCRFTWENSLHE